MDGRRGVWIGFAALCLLAGSRWVLEAAVPSPLPPGPRAAMHAGLLAFVLGVVSLLRSGSTERLPKVAWLGALVFAVPGAVVAGASGRVAGLTEELVFLLLPLVVVFAVAQTAGFGAGEDVRRLFGPALAGLAGAALLVPFTLPASTAGRGWLAALVATVILAGWAAVQLHREMRGVHLLPAVAAVAVSSALVASLARGWGLAAALRPMDWAVEAGEALLIDGPLLLLGLWCLGRMAPIQFSARVLLILLIAILESFLAARPPVTWTMGAGALLMAGGAAWLLREGTLPAAE